MKENTKKKLTAFAMICFVLVGLTAIQLSGVVGEAFYAVDRAIDGQGGWGLAGVGAFWSTVVGIANPIAGAVVTL